MAEFIAMADSVLVDDLLLSEDDNTQQVSENKGTRADLAVRSMNQKQLKELYENREKSFYYDQSVDMYDRAVVHSDGVYPKKMMDCRRPNEPEEAREYREKIWIEKTKPAFDRVMGFFNKIRRSSEWNISYKDSSKLSRIAEEDQLQVYAEMEYPGFTSFTNWMFKVCLKQYLIDPNAVLFIKPVTLPVGNEHLRPIATIYNSEYVLRFVPDQYAVLANPEGAYFYVNGKPTLGKSFYIITRWTYHKLDQINARGDFAINEDESFIHELGVMPAFKLQAVVKSQHDDEILYESRIAGMFPDLDEAVREYSDLQAAKVLHMYPERVEFSNTECRDCAGSGRRKVLYGDDFRTESCTSCGGHGYISVGPFAKHIIKPAGMDEQPLPNPPIQYVQKDIEIIKLQEDSVEKHIWDAYSAINLEMIAKVPAAESGIAKAYDQDESNNTLHAVGEDIVYIMDRSYFIFGLYRYNQQYTPEEILEEIVPTISVPERFDILTTGMLEEEIGKAKTSNLSSVILNQLEKDYASKRFYSNQEVGERLALVLLLDPFANISEEEKNSRLMNKGITNLDYIISSNIETFVSIAIEEDAEFIEKPIEDQRAKMKELADAQIASQQAAFTPAPNDDLYAPDDSIEEEENVSDDTTTTNTPATSNTPPASAPASASAPAPTPARAGNNQPPQTQTPAANDGQILAEKIGVGGVQGIINVLTSTLSIDSKVSTLEIVFGLTHEEAVSMVGTEQVDPNKVTVEYKTAK